MNAVGLQGPGVAAWLADGLPRLAARGATVVASIWGRTTDEFASAAEALRDAPVAALEVNVSCPNLHDGSAMFAHSPTATAAAVGAAMRSGLPCWAKLSPTTDRLVDVARAAVDAGATRARAREHAARARRRRGAAHERARRRARAGCPDRRCTRSPRTGSPRATRRCRRRRIVGVGGVRSAHEVVSFVLAGADAVEVGTASLADPRAPWKVAARDTAVVRATRCREALPT